MSRPRGTRYQDLLFAHQPAEGSPGFTTADLVSYGSAAGITGQEAIAGGLAGTPTVKVDGTALGINETLSPTGLRTAVNSAR
jgi:hypothetical protein